MGKLVDVYGVGAGEMVDDRLLVGEEGASFDSSGSLRAGWQAKIDENVLVIPNERRAVTDECVRALALAGGDGTGYREHITILLDRESGGNERPALPAGLDDDDSKTQPADDAISPWKMARVG